MTAESPVFAGAAPALYEFGFNVVPIKPGWKDPPVKWKRWQFDRQTPADVRELRESFPAHDIAVILGRVSGVVDLDVDNGDVGEQTLRALNRPVPPTASFTSPGDRRKPKKPGSHRLYRFRGPLASLVLGKGLELRADCTISVIPPSTDRAWVLGLDHLADLPMAWTAETTSRSGTLDDGAAGPITAGPEPPRTLVGSTQTQVGPMGVPPSVLLAIATSDLLATGGLVAVEAAPEFLPRVASLLGFSPDLGRAFRCPLPGHGRDEHPSATLWRVADGTIKLHDWHRKNGLEYFSLAEVFAARKSGRVRSLRGPELATWKLRMLVEAGLVEPVHVDIPCVPGETSPVAVRVIAAFCQLLSCKWLYSAGDPSPFTWKFAAAWCRLTERQVGEAIRELLRLGVLRRVGTWKRAALYLPGGQQ